MPLKILKETSFDKVIKKTIQKTQCDPSLPIFYLFFDSSVKNNDLKHTFLNAFSIFITYL